MSDFPGVLLFSLMEAYKPAGTFGGLHRGHGSDLILLPTPEGQKPSTRNFQASNSINLKTQKVALACVVI